MLDLIDHSPHLLLPILEVSITTKPISLFFNILHEILLFFAAFLY